jgi:predicted ABC-type ATPase
LSGRQKPPSLTELLSLATANRAKPLAVVLAGHNGSGKTSLWTQRLSDDLRIPLINADRLTESILPARDRETNRLPSWAQHLRDSNEDWQYLSQQGVQAFLSVAMEKKLPFAFETVFSHWEPRSDGTFKSKGDLIRTMQSKGYFVVLLFVGLQSVDVSIVRVANRQAKGGHAVPLDKLLSRFPRTQQAIGHAAAMIADMSVMFDNSRKQKKAFSLVRAQKRDEVLFDCRDPRYEVEPALRDVAGR